MKVGDLVKWSQRWLNGCSNAKDPYQEFEHYKDQIGIIIQTIEHPENCLHVLWSDGEQDEVHCDYLEVICK